MMGNPPAHRQMPPPHTWPPAQRQPPDDQHPHQTHDVPVIEDLNIAGIMAGSRPKAQADAAMGEIRRQLEYKCPWQHAAPVVAHRQYPGSKLCSSCQSHNAKLKRERY